MRIILLIIPVCLLALTAAKRVQIRQRIAEPQVYYEDEGTQVAEEEFAAAPVYQPRTRALHMSRSKDTLLPSKAPPVQTIRNYNKVNDDGSFTFGYEAADGSFKEETRGTDCVVRGKYGYVDPDGNKREFTYVSGNPCDPNAPREDDDELSQKQVEDDTSGPANYPSIRPVARPRPKYSQTTTARAPTTIFQTEYQLDDDASQELEEEEPTKPQLAPAAFGRPQQHYLKVQSIQAPSLYNSSPAPTSSLYRLSTPAPQYQSITTPAPVQRARLTTPSYEAVETSTRFVARERPQSVAITPRPYVAQVAAQYVSPSSTERPGVVYATRTSRPSAHRSASTTASTPQHHLNFAAELERYVNTVGITSPLHPSSTSNAIPATRVKGEPIYQSELAYNPATGQYNTQLYQSLSQTVGDIRLSHKLQPLVAQSQSSLGLQQLKSQQPQGQHQSPIYRQPARQQQPESSMSVTPRPQEAIYRQQQAELLAQSQQLYAQQQRRQQQPSQQPPQRFQLLESQGEPHAYYYVQAPSGRGSGSSLSIGQTDPFVRGSTGNF